MQKITFIFYFGFLLFISSCSVSGDDVDIQQASTQSNTNAEKTARTDWAFIAQELVQSYNNNYSTTGSTLAQKIVRLGSASLEVALYNDLKPIGFSLPTTTDAQVFLTNYESAYSNLSISDNMQSYFTALLYDDAEYDVILNTLKNDELLTTAEKEQLQFIVMYISETAGEPSDGIWKKRNIVAAIKGFEKSTVNALFNVALVEVSKN